MSVLSLQSLPLPSAMVRSISAPSQNDPKGIPKSTLAQSRDLLLALANQLATIKVPSRAVKIEPKCEIIAEAESEEKSEIVTNKRTFALSIAGIRTITAADGYIRGLKDANKGTKAKKEKCSIRCQLCTNVTLDLDLDSSVSALKNAICERFNLPLYYAKAMILVCGETILKVDSNPLRLYCVVENALILVCFKEGKIAETGTGGDEEKTEPLTEEDSDEMVFEAMGGVRDALGIRITAEMREFDTGFAGLAACLQRRLDRGNLPPTIEPSAPKVPIHELLEEMKIEEMKDVKDPILLDTVEGYRMPCGHGISGDSLMQYTLSALRSNQDYIDCPAVAQKDDKCGKRWQLPIIRKILSHHLQKENRDASADELASHLFELDLLAARNVVHKKSDVQRCGGCDTVLCRPLPKKKAKGTYSFKAVCGICSHDNTQRAALEAEKALKKANKPNFFVDLLPSIFGKKSDKDAPPKDELEKSLSQFSASLSNSQSAVLKNPIVVAADVKKTDKHEFGLCWGCGKTWVDPNAFHCGNADCFTQFRASIIDILQTCPTKKIGSVTDVPMIRACGCGTLITHWEYCKHIHCTNCNTQFCFVCLKPYLKGKGWQCGCSSDVCPIAPRQTMIARGAGGSPTKLFPEL